MSNWTTGYCRVMSVGLVVAVLAAIPASLGAQTIPAWAREVNEKWYAAFHAGDAASLVKLYTAEAVVLLPDQTLRGRAAVEAYFAKLFEKTRSSCKWVLDGVQAAGRQAAVLGHETCVETPKAGGASRTATLRFLTVFERQADGSWLVARDASEETKP